MASQDFSRSVMWLKRCREEAHLQVIREQGPRNTWVRQVLTARTRRLCSEPVQGQCSYTKVSFSFLKTFFLLSHSLLQEEIEKQDWPIKVFMTRDQNYSPARASLAGHITSQIRAITYDVRLQAGTERSRVVAHPEQLLQKPWQNQSWTARAN